MFNNKRLFLPLTILFVAIIIVKIGYIKFGQTNRDYCEVFREQKSLLAKSPKGSFPSSLFEVESGKANDLYDAYDSLSKAATSDITSDIDVMKKIYLDLDNNPGNLLSNSMVAKDADGRLKSYTISKCGD